MGCFGCFGPRARGGAGDLKPSRLVNHCTDDSSVVDARRKVAPDVGNGCAHSFTFKDLLVATGYFNQANFIGEGGFGKVYKGRISRPNAQGVSDAQMVAVKQLGRESVQGSTEFLVEVLMLTMLSHPNLVSLVGFCAQGDERLLVYEYMPFGSLERHLFDVPVGKQPLDWNTRMKIAVGVAEGLSYLHNVADPPIIYRDMKAANILLDEAARSRRDHPASRNHPPTSPRPPSQQESIPALPATNSLPACCSGAQRVSRPYRSAPAGGGKVLPDAGNAQHLAVGDPQQQHHTVFLLTAWGVLASSAPRHRRSATAAAHRLCSYLASVPNTSSQDRHGSTATASTQITWP